MNGLQWWSLLCGLLGFGLMIGGLALYSVPIALVVAGVMLLAYAVLLDKAGAVKQRQSSNDEKG